MGIGRLLLSGNYNNVTMQGIVATKQPRLPWLHILETESGVLWFRNFTHNKAIMRHPIWKHAIYLEVNS